MPAYPTREAWLGRAAALREQILASTGLWPMPGKTPLRPRVFGRMERPGYTVEKVHLQPWPGFYLGGNLFRPAKGPDVHDVGRPVVAPFSAPVLPRPPPVAPGLAAPLTGTTMRAPSLTDAASGRASS